MLDEDRTAEEGRRKAIRAEEPVPAGQPAWDIDPGTVEILAALSDIRSELEQLRRSQESGPDLESRPTAGPRTGPSTGPIELTLAAAALSALFATLGTGVMGIVLRVLSFLALLLSCLAGFSFFYNYVRVEFREATKASDRIAKVLGLVGVFQMWTLLLKRKRDTITTPEEDTLLGMLSLALSFLVLTVVLVLWFVASFATSLIALLQ
jgi:hypothetical protein